MTGRPSGTSPSTAGSRRRAGGTVAPLVGWTAFLVAGLVFLHGAGGAMAPPPLTDPGRLGEWLDRRQPAEAAVAVVRLLALGTAWYLLAVTVLGAIARMVGVRSLVRAADTVTVPSVRRLLTGALGVSLAAAVLTGAGGAAVADERAGGREAAAAAAAETMRRLPDAAGAGAGATTAAATSSPPTMRRLPAAPPAAPPAPPSTPTPPETATTTSAVPPTAGPSSPASTPSEDAAAAAAGGGPTWRVQPGDHFWSVAEQVLAEAWGRHPTDVEVDPYWRMLVDANRSVLRDADNPDLLFPDQVIAVPGPPSAP